MLGGRMAVGWAWQGRAWSHGSAAVHLCRLCASLAAACTGDVHDPPLLPPLPTTTSSSPSQPPTPAGSTLLGEFLAARMLASAPPERGAPGHVGPGGGTGDKGGAGGVLPHTPQRQHHAHSGGAAAGRLLGCCCAAVRAADAGCSATMDSGACFATLFCQVIWQTTGKSRLGPQPIASRFAR
jgi:hypothetical protein